MSLQGDPDSSPLSPTDAAAASRELLLEKLVSMSTTDIGNLLLATQIQAAAAPQPGPGAASPAVIPPAEIRQAKFKELYKNISQKSKLKPFSPSDDPREWLDVFEEEITSLAQNICGIDLATESLTDREFVELLRCKITNSVRKEILQKFDTFEPKLTFETVTKKQIADLLKEQFGAKEPDMSSFLTAFGPNRFKKTPEMPVKNFFCLWIDQLPPCLSPKTDQERIKAVDLMRRSAFYHSLDDKYLQEELSKVKESEQTLAKFREVAEIAEARRKHHQDIADKSDFINPKSDIGISKAEFYAARGRGGRRRGWNGVHRGVSADPGWPGRTPVGFQVPNSNVTPQSPPPPPSRGASRGRGQPRTDRNFDPTITCFKCYAIGHKANRCPNSNYYGSPPHRFSSDNSKVSVDEEYISSGDEYDMKKCHFPDVNSFKLNVVFKWAFGEEKGLGPCHKQSKSFNPLCACT